MRTVEEQIEHLWQCYNGHDRRINTLRTEVKRLQLLEARIITALFSTLSDAGYKAAVGALAQHLRTEARTTEGTEP